MNQLDRLRHAIHLQAYMSTAQTEPFPLDGSEWARLVSMRVNSMQKDSSNENCSDFWQKIHSEKTPVHRERKSLQQGIQRWFAGSTSDDSKNRTTNNRRFSELRSLWYEAEDSRSNYSPANLQPANPVSCETNDVKNDGIRFLSVQPDCI